MKQKLLLSFVISLFSLTTFAGCNNHMHCTQLTGLPVNSSDGRIIKAVTSRYTFISCVSSNTNLIPIDTTNNPLDYSAGNTTINFSICSDFSGEHCSDIGTDTFRYSASDYHGDFQPTRNSIPQTTLIMLPASLIKHMPACNAQTPPVYRARN